MADQDGHGSILKHEIQWISVDFRPEKDREKSHRKPAGWLSPSNRSTTREKRPSKRATPWCRARHGWNPAEPSSSGRPSCVASPSSLRTQLFDTVTIPSDS